MTFAATRRIFWALSSSKAIGAWPWTPHSPRPLLSPFQKPLPAFGLKFHNFPLDKFLPTSMGSVSNQNCCKGFLFKE